MIFNDRRKSGFSLYDKTFGRLNDQKINKAQVMKAHRAKENEPRPKFDPTNLSGEVKSRKNEWK